MSPATATAVVTLYERALGDVYGYLVRRCASAAIAEDLTAETFLAAARAADGGTELSVPWLIGTARHKLIDHWRREGRRRAALEELYDTGELADPIDPGDPVEVLHVHDLLGRLTPSHRAALTLRYLDGLPVEQVATHLDRSVHATESLLMRAKAAYRALATDHLDHLDPRTTPSAHHGDGHPEGADR
jgi:RNA polymerase sigma-70 factor (ECF subfamily)